MRKPLEAAISEWWKHCGLCCTIENDKIVVTEESCVCSPMAKLARKLLEATKSFEINEGSESIDLNDMYANWRPRPTKEDIEKAKKIFLGPKITRGGTLKYWGTDDLLHACLDDVNTMTIEERLEFLMWRGDIEIDE